ncbi:MAG: efflux RND transporter periplasmic adaptor subunit, partial [Bacteroidales bacterium]|nr:efflux RND transporter periplasmic adaptor subunit [Bacteroidales bacterium]
MKQIKGLYLALFTAFISCQTQNNSTEDAPQNLQNNEKTVVKTHLALKKQFDAEIVSNGKIISGKYYDLYWKVNGVINKIYFRNGSRVKKGEIIADIEDFKLKNNFESAEASLQQAELQMQDVIISQGYAIDDKNIPEKVIKNAKIKSGFLQSQASYNLAKYEYENCKLIAPISGIVANIENNESDPTGSKPFCRIISDNQMMADFTIMESELEFVKQGSKAEVSVFSIPEKSWQSVICEINPSVDKNGMLKVKAEIFSPSGLLEGMNVAIKIKRNSGSFVAVNKSAVVSRSGRKVVFTCKDCVARWNYVEVSGENSSEFAISDGIAEGDSVIYD